MAQLANARYHPPPELPALRPAVPRIIPAVTDRPPRPLRTHVVKSVPAYPAPRPAPFGATRSDRILAAFAIRT